MMRSWTGLSAGNRQQNASFEQPGIDLSSGFCYLKLPLEAEFVLRLQLTP